MLTLLVFILLVASVAVGARPVPLGQVLQALTDPAEPAAADATVIVRDLRVPRTVLALLIAPALGLAGALMQAVTRNPIADPGILGVSAGAAFAVVVGISTGVVTVSGQLWLALVGAAVASGLVYGVAAAAPGGPTPVRLALAGAALTGLLGSLTAALALLDARTLDQFRFWQVGALAGRDLGVALDVAPVLLAGAVLAAGLASSLNALALGDDVAAGLGLRLRRVRALTALAVVLLTGGAVAACGPIAFVGLVAPHLARPLAGTDLRWLLPASGLLAAVLLLTADIAGRLVARPAELPVGVVTALVGAPFFVALLCSKPGRRATRAGLGAAR